MLFLAKAVCHAVAKGIFQLLDIWAVSESKTGPIRKAVPVACARRALTTMQVTLEQAHDIINRNDGNQDVHIASLSEITSTSYRCAFENSRVI